MLLALVLTARQRNLSSFRSLALWAKTKKGEEKGGRPCCGLFSTTHFIPYTKSCLASPPSLRPGLTALSGQWYPSVYHFPHSFVYLPIYSSAFMRCLISTKLMASAPVCKVLRSVYRVIFLNMLLIIALLSSGVCSVAFLSTVFRVPCNLIPRNTIPSFVRLFSSLLCMPCC